METARKRPKVKICGLTRECDIDYINEAAPDYIGFVFAPSRRRIEEKTAGILKEKVKSGIQTVGVFVDAPIEKVIRLAKDGVIDVIQLHGKESPAYVSEVRERTGYMVIKAMQPEQGNSGNSLYQEYEHAGTDFFLFDSAAGGGRNAAAGGTGRCFDWSRIPQTGQPFFLAGGLDIANIEDAIEEVNPYALDISSGVETDGLKDREKILEIIRRIRNV